MHRPGVCDCCCCCCCWEAFGSCVHRPQAQLKLSTAPLEGSSWFVACLLALQHAPAGDPLLLLLLLRSLVGTDLKHHATLCQIAFASTGLEIGGA